MCDQGIITAELNMDIQTTSSTVAISATRFRVAVAVIARSVLPAVVGVYYAYLRNQKTVVESVRRQVWPAFFAFVANSLSRSLSSVHRGICFPLTLRTVIQKSQPAIMEDDDAPEKCVECCVLYEPSEHETIMADVIFIHGIHGSLFKTWKQGLWQSDRHKIKQAILERSKSVDLDIVYPKTPLKRTVSDDYSNRPSKFSRMENLTYVDNNNDVEFREEDDEEEQEEAQIPSYSKCWPKDWLSKDCPGIRVIALNYTTDPNLWRPVWIKKKNRSGLVERSKEMIDHLLKLKVGKHPIVWVGHSKGGLYVKQIIIYAWENSQENLRNLYLQSKAIMFYSVPHRGSAMADFTLPFIRRSVELLEVQRNCRFVLNLHKKFVEVLENGPFQPDIFSFIETSLTFMSFLYLRIVALDSADPGVGSKWGVPLDHREICKPSNRNCFLYRELVQLIEKVVYNAKT